MFLRTTHSITFTAITLNGCSKACMRYLGLVLLLDPEAVYLGNVGHMSWAPVRSLQAQNLVCRSNARRA